MSHQYLSDVDRMCTGATRKRISRKKLGKIRIPLPPLSEQQRIVSILDESFAAIDTAIANTEKNLVNAQESFESQLAYLFSRKDEEYVDIRVDKLCKVINGYAFKSADFSPDNQIKSVKITNVGVQEFVTEDITLLPVEFASLRSDVQVLKGDIVIALTRSIISSGFKVAIVPDTYDSALLNQRVAALRSNDTRVSQRYLYLYLCTQRVVNYVKAMVNTLMQPNLSIKDLKALPVPTPSLSTQKKVVEKLDNIWGRTQRLKIISQQKINTLTELKQSFRLWFQLRSDRGS